MGSLSCQLACSNQLQCRIKTRFRNCDVMFWRVFSFQKEQKLAVSGQIFGFYMRQLCHILECVLKVLHCDEIKFFFFAILFIGSYGHCGIANNLMLGQDRWRIFDFARKVFLISMLSSLICGFMTGFGGTAQLLISYNYENGRII